MQHGEVAWTRVPGDRQLAMSVTNPQSTPTDNDIPETCSNHTRCSTASLRDKRPSQPEKKFCKGIESGSPLRFIYCEKAPVRASQIEWHLCRSIREGSTWPCACSRSKCKLMHKKLSRPSFDNSVLPRIFPPCKLVLGNKLSFKILFFGKLLQKK